MRRYIKRAEAEMFEKLLAEAQNVIIISHTNPDGDAVGSVTAMRNYLNCREISSTVVLPNKYPDYLSFLDNKTQIKIFSDNHADVLKSIDNANLIIALDFNQLKRVDELESHILDSSASKVLIDHHPFPEKDAFDLVISNTEVSSTCELLYWLISLLEELKSDILTIEGVVLESPNSCALSLEVANSLYVGMMTDTNNFANSVSSSTLLMASHLIDSGINKEELQSLVFGGFCENRMRLMGHLLLNKMVVLDKYNAAFIILSIEEKKHFNYSDGDSEGFVNLPLNIKGISISALFTENEDDIRVSLRSSNNFSVNKLARLYFNGAGHERAAGGRLNIKIEEVADYFKTAVERGYKECIDNDEK